MQDFVALDFETANNNRASACEISLVHFKDGEPVNSLTSLLSPPEGLGTFIHTGIHGISERDCQNSPTLADLLPEVARFVGDRPVLCHNSGFDFSVLRQTLDAFSVPYPEMRYGCTLAISKSAFRDDPGIVSYALPRVCWHLRIPFTETHRAESDATACGRVAGKLLAYNNCENLEDLASTLAVTLGAIGPDLDERCRAFGVRKYRSELVSSAVVEAHTKALGVAKLDPGGDFIGKSVVLTGKLQSMTRREAETLLEAIGARLSGSVSRKTDYLIEGQQDQSNLKADGVSGKHRKCMELKAQGCPIEVLDEQMFLENLCD